MSIIVIVVIVVAAVLFVLANGSCVPEYPQSQFVTGSATLYLVADSELKGGDIVTMQSLGGMLARSTPRLYRVSVNEQEQSSYAQLWLSDMVKKRAVQYDDTLLHNFPGIIRQFAAEIKGFVKFSATLGESVNAAITYCAGSEGIIAASEPDTINLLVSLGISQVDDLTTATVSNIYQKLRSNFNHRMVSFQPPSKSGNLAEYAVFSRCPTVEYMGNDGGITARMILSDIQNAGNCGIAIGWGPEEKYVSTLAGYGVYVHASDWAKDLTPLSNVREQKSVNLAANYGGIDGVMDDNVHTVSFLMTDGDNIQWLLGSWATDNQWFGAKARGSVNMGWTLSPALAKLAPEILDYVNDVRTDKDGFVCSPSGVGYTFPEVVQDLPDYAAVTATYMNTTNMRILNVIGHSDDSKYLLPFLEQDEIDALIYYTFDEGYSGGRGKLSWLNGKPVISGRRSLWGEAHTGTMLGVDGLVDFLSQQPKGIGNEGSYSLIPVHAWSHNYDDVAKTVNGLNAKGGFRILTPTQFVDAIINEIKH